MIYSEIQINTYLKKIGYDKKIILNGSTLEQLQIAHLKSIPYENLDILNKVSLSLEAEDLYNKMILNSRGGYCFELNGLYSNLLKSLGFDVTNLAGRYIDSETTFQMRRHRILKVKTEDGTYLCDVGVRSESPRKALKLVDGLVQNDGVCDYKLEKDDFYGHILWQKEQGKVWRKIYGFTEEPQIDIDYIMPSFFCEKHPDSPFIDIRKISVFTDTSVISIVDDVLKIYEFGKVVERVVLNDAAETQNALLKYFKIILKK